MTTERYIRERGQWVKITRDAKRRVFTIARGWKGEAQASSVTNYPFSYLPTWADAEQVAKQHIADHA